MLPKCEFCFGNATVLCCVPRCRFQPYICAGPCNNHASHKVHSHSEITQQSSTIQIEKFQFVMSTKKQPCFDTISAIKKSIHRIIQQFNHIYTRLESSLQNIIQIDPMIHGLLQMQKCWSSDMTGNDINVLINRPFFNAHQLQTKNNLIQVISDIILQIQQATNKCQDQLQSSITSIQASRLIQKQNYTQSIPLLEKCTALTPFNLTILHSLAWSYYKIRNYPKSIVYLQKYTQLNSNNSKVYCMLSDLYFKQKQYTKSIENCSKAIDIEGDQSKYYFNRGFIYAQMKDYERALYDLTKAIQLRPNSAEQLYHRGNVYLDQEMLEEALLDYSMAISLERNAKYFHNRAIVLRKFGRIEEQKSDRRMVRDISESR